jgi:hypothetical protein
MAKSKYLIIQYINFIIQHPYLFYIYENFLKKLKKLPISNRRSSDQALWHDSLTWERKESPFERFEPTTPSYQGKLDNQSAIVQWKMGSAFSFIVLPSTFTYILW